MKYSELPSVITSLFASGASSSAVTDIPDTQAASGDGRVSWKLGYPPETMIARSAGGVPPYGQDANGIGKKLSQYIQALQAGNIPKWTQDFANAIGGYPSGALAADPSTVGVFWVSTADDNTTQPGANGASWQSLFNGYATQAWSSSQFVGRGASVYDFTPLQLGVNKASGQVWTSYTDDSGNLKYAFSQPAGDYATNTALNSETTRATQAESNLQTSKVSRSGDTMRGALSTYNDPNLTNGAWNYAPAFRSYTNTRSGFRLIAQDKVGDAGTAGGALILDWNGTDKQYWWFNPDGTITQSTNGRVAWQTDISNLQSQVNSKQPSGNYVTGTSAGKKIVTFTASVSGTQDISFHGLSSVDVVLGSCSTQPGSSNQRGGIIQINSWTSNSVNVTGKFTSTNISDSTDLPCYFVAIGDE